MFAQDLLTNTEAETERILGCASPEKNRTYQGNASHKVEQCPH